MREYSNLNVCVLPMSSDISIHCECGNDQMECTSSCSIDSIGTRATSTATTRDWETCITIDGTRRGTTRCTVSSMTRTTTATRATGHTRTGSSTPELTVGITHNTTL